MLPDEDTGQKVVPIGYGYVTVQGGYGAVFAVQVQCFLSSLSVAVQRFLSGFITVTVQGFCRWAGAVSRHNLSQSQ